MEATQAFSSSHARRPTMSVYFSFSFVTQKVVDTEMELGMQTFLGRVTLMKGLVGRKQTELGRESLRPVTDVC